MCGFDFVHIPHIVNDFGLIAKKTIEGKGLDWREQIPKQDKEKILKEYNSIYSRIGKG